MLADMLEGREKLSTELQRIIDARTEPWGINVISVEVKDVQIPAALQDAMSMQAQAERERQARVILGNSERQVAEKFGEAAKTYADNPTAFHLRAMNMLYEGLKRSNATIVIVPSTAVETMQLGASRGGDRRERDCPRPDGRRRSARGGYGIITPPPGGHGFASQTPVAYSRIVRSLENLPEAAMLWMTLRVHSSGLRWSSQIAASARM